MLFSADPRYTSTLLRESYPVGSPRWAGAMLTAVPRQLRVEYPGAIYHVLSRGDRQKDIYLDDVDRQDFLKTLAEACQKTGFQIHAYCLMRNHFHLVVETPNGNLVAGMRWLVAMAGRLSRETTLTIRAIAERLHMGSWKSLNNRLYLVRKTRKNRNRKEPGSEKLCFDPLVVNSGKLIRCWLKEVQIASANLPNTKNRFIVGPEAMNMKTNKWVIILLFIAGLFGTPLFLLLRSQPERPMTLHLIGATNDTAGTEFSYFSLSNNSPREIVYLSDGSAHPYYHLYEEHEIDLGIRDGMKSRQIWGTNHNCLSSQTCG